MKAAITAAIVVTEILAGFGVSTSNNSIAASLAASVNLDGTTTPPVTKHGIGELAMVDGAATIDLRTLLNAAGAAVDGNGLKVQAVIFVGKVGNANPIKVAVGDTTGYELAGADFAVTLKAGDFAVLGFKDSLADIDATHKILDVTGTGTQVLQYLIVMG